MARGRPCANSVVFAFAAIIICLLIFSPIVAQGKAITVKVGAYQNPPKIFKNQEGQIDGFWPELIGHIASLEGWNIEYVYGTWKECMKRLETGEIQIMPDMGFSQERSGRFLFSRYPIILSWTRVYVRKDDDRIHTILDIDGKTVAALKGSINLEGPGGLREIVNKFNLHCHFSELGDYFQVFESVKDGRADAGITNRNFGNKYAKKYGLKMTPIIFQPINMRFAFPNDAPQAAYLAARIDAHMREFLKDDGSVYYRLLKKYFEAGIAEKQVFPGWGKVLIIITSSAAAAIALVFIGVFYWNRSLRMQINRATGELRKELAQRELAQRALKESLARVKELEAIINKSPAVAFLWRAEEGWPVEYVSDNVRQFGYDAGDFTSGKMLYAEIVHKDDVDRVAHEVKKYSDEGVDGFSQEYRIITKDGKVRWTVDYTWIRRDEEGKITHYQGIVQDVTEQKNMEDELDGYRRSLEKKVAERTKELEEANKRLRELDRLKSLFIATMSHELRTPLNSIIGFTGVILQGLSGDINDEQRDQLQRVYRSAKHLLNLITDIIDISKIEAGKLAAHVSEFQLSDLVDEAIATIKQEADKKGLKIEAYVPQNLWMASDRQRLLQCILNYLSNGVKFTSEGTISVRAEEKGGSVEIVVEDTGIGIPEQDLARLFSSFVRLEGTAMSSIQGTGLGLYLTKKITTEMLQGQVFVESRQGVGSKFGLRIPKRLKLN